MLLLSCGRISNVARQISKPCAKGLIVIRHSLTVFSRLVSRRHPLSPVPFVKRWPDLSEPSLIRFLFLDGLMTMLPKGTSSRSCKKKMLMLPTKISF